MTLSDLLNKIRLGEDHFLELKEVRFTGNKISGPKQVEIANELAAFANSNGGELLLGVENTTRSIVGIPIDRLDNVEDLVRQAATDSIHPSLSPIIERITLPNENGEELPILRIVVSRSLFVHQSPAGYLQRVGSAKRPIPPDQLARLFQQRSQSCLIRFDETPVYNAIIDDLQEALWRRFFPIAKQTDELNIQERNIILNKLAMAVRSDDNIWRPTVAGLLMASEQPERFLPNAYIQAVAYVGDTVIPSDANIYQLDAQDITGQLDKQIFAACDFVQKNMQVAARKSSSGGRVDIPQYDMLTIFEAVTNAVAHRDYSMGGSKIRLRMFSDRLEISTPGMLPNTMSTESLAFRQSTRNEAITSLLSRCPVKDNIGGHRNFIMDKRGEGVPIILERSELLSKKKPIYQMIDNTELLLTIFANQS